MKNQSPHNQILGNRILTSQNSQGREDRRVLSKMYNSIQSNQYGISNVLHYSHKSDITDILRLGVCFVVPAGKVDIFFKRIAGTCTLVL